MPENSNSAYGAGKPGTPLPSSASFPFLLAGMFFIACSVFLLYTLVLEEDYLGSKMELLKDSAVLISAPALIGLTLAAIAVKRSRKR